ncbi:MAG: Na/Pi cotransporter family protein [Deltaproteobacteria bacterium]|nr:Na/Pi cotransporter family protein [Candidatus Anaeroferrophillacea bacterium]
MNGMTDINLLLPLAGLGMFMLGMRLLEDGLKQAAGGGLRRLIRRSTGTIPAAMGTGMLTTAVLQSSSMISLLVLSLVGAGLMPLTAGVGVIFGANLGTTATAWLVAVLGFKLSLAALALPAVGAGGILLIFAGDHRHLTAAAWLLAGLGLLLLGIDYMKEGLGDLAAMDFSRFWDYPVAVFVAIGALLTAAIRSSSATTATTLGALQSGIITFPMAAALLIGANIGTTVTAMLGALGGVPDKKRVALAHLLFNGITAVLALTLLRPLIHLVLVTARLQTEPVFALALFHTLFNALGIIILGPFIPRLAVFLERCFKSAVHPLAHYIDRVPAAVPEAALAALRQEIDHLLENAMKFILLLLNLNPVDILHYKIKVRLAVYEFGDFPLIRYEELYDRLKRLEVRILAYAADVAAEPLEPSEGTRIATMVQAARDIVFAAKLFYDIRRDFEIFGDAEEGTTLQDLRNQFRRRVARLLKNIQRLIEGETDRGKKLGTIFGHIAADNDQAIGMVVRGLREEQFDDPEAARLINVNRSVTMASEFLLRVVDRLHGISIPPEEEATATAATTFAAAKTPPAAGESNPGRPDDDSNPSGMPGSTAE